MHVPVELLGLLRNATIVVDNARRPSVSLTESVPAMPALSRCSPKNSHSSLPKHHQDRRTSMPASRWESIPIQGVSSSNGCGGSDRRTCLHQPCRPQQPTSPIRAPRPCIQKMHSRQALISTPTIRQAMMMHNKSTDQRPRPPPRRASSSKTLLISAAGTAVTAPTATCGCSIPTSSPHISHALNEAIHISQQIALEMHHSQRC
jgi:hypothetical protein